MATRSTISIEAAGRVEVIYCHWDGYPEGVGEILLNNYITEGDVFELLLLGNTSSLGKSTEDTVAYCRDKGEDFSMYAEEMSLEEWHKMDGEEYNYIFSNGNWAVRGDNFNKVKFGLVYDKLFAVS